MNEKKTKDSKDENSLKGSWLWGALLFVLLLFVDQLTKLLADVYFQDYAKDVDKIVIIPNMIELCMSYNRGIAFSMFATSNIYVKMAIVLSTGVMMAAIGYIYFKIDKRRVWLRVACVLVIAGGIGNLIDRVYYQIWDPASFNGGIRDGVRDMVRVRIIFDFGVCNFADFFICGGAAALALSALFFDSYAYLPVGKYKGLAKEAEIRDKEKEEIRKAKKQAKKLVKNENFNGARSLGVIGGVDDGDEDVGTREQNDDQKAE